MYSLFTQQYCWDIYINVAFTMLWYCNITQIDGLCCKIINLPIVQDIFHVLEYVLYNADKTLELRWANKKEWVIASYTATPMVMCEETDSKSKWVNKHNTVLSQSCCAKRLFCCIHCLKVIAYVMLCLNLMTVQKEDTIYSYRKSEQLKQSKTKSCCC